MGLPFLPSQEPTRGASGIRRRAGDLHQRRGCGRDERMPLVLVILLYAVAAVWVLVVFMMLSGGATLKRLPPLNELPEPQRPPSVSVIVPARDEAARIGDTVRRLFAQKQVEL